MTSISAVTSTSDSSASSGISNEQQIARLNQQIKTLTQQAKSLAFSLEKASTDEEKANTSTAQEEGVNKPTEENKINIYV
ncbi:MAG: FlxA-like family protein [Symbiopectobacterium sp.]|uniref:FlxA-like family protein n=1 Tax=Symbiopectobacterium sp. TaxID=2952789 RepID=UPI003F342B7F